MQMSRRARPHLIALATAGALALSACGGSPATPSSASPAPSATPSQSGSPVQTTTIPAADPTQSQPAPSAGTNIFPAIDVIDVASGDTVNLATVTTGSTPTLVWFWAPH